MLGWMMGNEMGMMWTAQLTV